MHMESLVHSAGKSRAAIGRWVSAVIVAAGALLAARQQRRPRGRAPRRRPPLARQALLLIWFWMTHREIKCSSLPAFAKSWLGARARRMHDALRGARGWRAVRGGVCARERREAERARAPPVLGVSLVKAKARVVCSDFAIRKEFGDSDGPNAQITHLPCRDAPPDGAASPAPTQSS